MGLEWSRLKVDFFNKVNKYGCPKEEEIQPKKTGREGEVKRVELKQILMDAKRRVLRR